MSPLDLQQYLHKHIPISEAMQVSAESVSPESVILRAPLAPNINHRETVFGGSASAVAILAAWSLLHCRLRAEGIDCKLVIRRNSMEYEKPIDGEFTAKSSLQDPEHWPMFLHMLSRKGKARISVISMLEYSHQIVGRFAGEFVALEVRG